MADGKGAEGSGIPRAKIGIPHNDIHRVIIYIEFFRQQLRYRRHGSLTHLDFPGIQDDSVIDPDSQKRVEIGGDPGAEKTGTGHTGQSIAIQGIEIDYDPSA